jgi:hypothetical protein
MHVQTAKIVYYVLPPEEWSDRLPESSPFAHAYRPKIIQWVISQWYAYGYS